MNVDDYSTSELILECRRQADAIDVKPGEPDPLRDLLTLVVERMRQYQWIDRQRAIAPTVSTVKRVAR